jgi:hypothetical protein
MYDLFISYRTTHRDWVETLAFNLKDQGYSVFLDQWELIPGQDFAQACEQLLRLSPLPAQLYTGFRSDQDRIALCDFLQQTKLGRYDPWPADEPLRRLYWSNLITRRGQDLCGRCEFIRQVGQEILPCN